MSRVPNNFVELLSADRIRSLVGEVAAQIDRHYRGSSEALVCVGVLKGAWIFHSDLVRQLNVPVIVDFIRASSYGSATESSGVVRILKDIEVDIRNRDVLLVEEIIDSGRTLDFIKKRLEAGGAKSVRICALLDKKERRVVDCRPDFLGTEVPNHFLVGYGLDWGEKFRTLPAIYQVIDSNR
jgi:hypoxanthine phosphoribosyltransferase